jgi:hypothetical protein
LVYHQPNLLRNQVTYVYERNQMYERKFDQAGVLSVEIKTLEEDRYYRITCRSIGLIDLPKLSVLASEGIFNPCKFF